MTTYLTKTEAGETHHYRVTVEPTSVSIVEGIFYNWLTKSIEGCGDHASAIARHEELIAAKLKNGFTITPFTESPENSLDVYDKAKWHFGGDFPSRLDDFQGYVHTGMFVGWLVDNNLMSADFKLDFEEEIEAFKNRTLTGSQLFEQCCDGVLMLDDISEMGNRFALSYFELGNGEYLADYDAALCKGLPTMYHVVDSWENYEMIKGVLDERFAAWKKSTE